MKLVLKLFVALLVVGIVYLLAWPVPIEPLVWQVPEYQGYTGDFVQNERLEQFEKYTMGDLTGPEAAAIDHLGDIIAATHEGWLVKWSKGQTSAERWVNVGGRPLGLDIGQDGRVWVANAYAGLQVVTPDGSVSVVLDTIDGTSIEYADDVVVAPDGSVYFSDATQRFSPKQWGGTFPASVLDIVEHGKTGRIIRYIPDSGDAKVVMTDLNFANGVTADPKGRFLLVNETGEYRVWKLWLTGEKAGQKEVILNNLPGFPDNIHLGLNNKFWIGVMAPRSSDLDKVADKPFLRKMMMRLPEKMKPQAEPYGMVIAIDENGRVLANLQSPSGSLYTTTGVAETENDLFITSLTAPFLARVSKQDAQLTK